MSKDRVVATVLGVIVLGVLLLIPDFRIGLANFVDQPDVEPFYSALVDGMCTAEVTQTDPNIGTSVYFDDGEIGLPNLPLFVVDQECKVASLDKTDRDMVFSVSGNTATIATPGYLGEGDVVIKVLHVP